MKIDNHNCGPGLAVAMLLLFHSTATANDNSAVQSFLNTHCVHCHGADTQEGGHRFDSIGPPEFGTAKYQTWVRIVDAVETGEMPPQGEPRPEQKQINAFVNQIATTLAKVRKTRPAALRRLNRREYENTVHDLLQIEAPLADLLPEDGSVQGFDNVADGLSISSVLVEQYLEAADVAFEKSIRRIKPLPPATRRAELMQIKDNIESVKKNKGGVIEVKNAFVDFTPGWPPARMDPAFPIEGGTYRCRVAVWPHDPGKRTLSVAIYVGTLFGPETRKFIGIFDVTGTPEIPRIIEFTTHFEEGHAIHVLPRVWPEHVTWRDKHEKRPGVGIVWAETYGPLDQSFPSDSTKLLFGDTKSIAMKEEWPIYMRHRKGVKKQIVVSNDPQHDAEAMIRTLIKRAFRRPVSEEEIKPFVTLTLKRLEQGRTFEQAARAGVTAVLCAPQFLLLNQEPEVDDFTLASRLSYFLWSTMPDEELLQLAGDGKLSQPDVLHAQVERMIGDPRNQRFVIDFTDQWLDLQDIEFTTPDAKLYPEFDPLLQEAMLGETRHFFNHMLTEDLSVLNFVDSDWTFLNERMARHYGIDGVKGHETFRKVTLPGESVRGGVLTHASVLKVTANGTTSSPVLRGVWVLDKMLGRPAPPPPAGVPAVEPDIRGATTIREQLDQHRAIASCASCHRRIDPPGFALEEFDVIGGHRDWYRSLDKGETIPGKKSYRKGLPVESGAVLPDGETFANFKEYRQQLTQNDEQIARAIAMKLLTYATGRPITLADRLTVNQVVERSRETKFGLKSMIHAVVASELFAAP